MANSRDEILLQLLLLRSPHYRQSYILHGRVVERKRKSKFFRISLQISFPLLLNEPFQIRELLSQSSPLLPTPSQFQSNVSEISSIMRHPKFSSFPRSLELFYTINRHQMDAQTGVKKWSPPCHMISLSCACCSFIITDADDGDFGGVAVHKTLIHSVDNG